MPSWKTIVFFLLTATLLTNETVFSLVLEVFVSTLTIVHVLLTRVNSVCTEWFRSVYPDLRSMSENFIAVGKDSMNIGAAKLIEGTALFMHHVQGGCHVIRTWIMSGSEFVAKSWTAGVARDQAVPAWYPVLDTVVEQAKAAFWKDEPYPILKEAFAYCKKVGGCTLRGKAV